MLWFMWGFLGMIAANSFLAIPPAISSAGTDAGNLLLALAMAAIGMGTRLSAIRDAGFKPILLGLLLLTWLVLGGAAVNRIFSALLA